MYIYYKNLKLNLFCIILLLFIFFIFLQKVSFLKNIYYISFKSHNIRFIKSYENKFYSGYCTKESHGYVSNIAHKYKNKYFQTDVPKIVNYDKIRRLPYWIFLQNEFKPNDKYLIILNLKMNENDFKYFDYKIIDNYENRCFFLVKND